MFAECPAGADVTVECHARDPEFFAEHTDGGVPIAHSGLGEPDLSFAEFEFPSAFPTACPRRL